MPAHRPPWACSYAPGPPLRLDDGDTNAEVWERSPKHHRDRPASDLLRTIVDR